MNPCWYAKQWKKASGIISPAFPPTGNRKAANTVTPTLNTTVTLLTRLHHLDNLPNTSGIFLVRMTFMGDVKCL